LIATLSKVYQEAQEWAFTASIASHKHGLKARRYSYDEKKDTTKARANLLKALKADGFKVLMVQ
jgi:hypothetical protein